MITIVVILVLLNGFSIGLFYNENNGKLSKTQWFLFSLMIFIGIFVLLSFAAFHKYLELSNKKKRK